MTQILATIVFTALGSASRLLCVISMYVSYKFHRIPEHAAEPQPLAFQGGV